MRRPRVPSPNRSRYRHGHADSVLAKVIGHYSTQETSTDTGGDSPTLHETAAWTLAKAGFDIGNGDIAEWH
jgi:hypothetical protein